MYRIILSADENKDYIEMLPYVYAGWKKFFPEFEITIARVINTDNLYNVNNTNIFNLLNISCSANQAKLARFYLASQYPDDICMIHDIDSICLQREYYFSRLQKRKENNLLTMGYDFYKETKNTGKFPIGYMTAEGKIFNEIFNVGNKSWHEWIHYIADLKGISVKENIKNPFKIFSDESLIKFLLKNWKGKIQNLPLDYVLKEDCICRWRGINLKKLQENGYIEAHHLIPFSKYKEYFKIIKTYLDMI